MAHQLPSNGKIMALDVGDVRIGVAMASAHVKIASPYGVIANDANVWESIQAIVDSEDVQAVVVGLPRSMQGNHTEQTTKTQNFTNQLEEHFKLPIAFQDEAGTSIKAQNELHQHPNSKYSVDELAATYILEDYLVGAV